MAKYETKKPIPRVDEETKGYWEACRRHELYIQRCRNCDTKRLYPRAVCPKCLADDTEWLRCAGTGSVYTFTVTHQNQAPGFREELPYVLAYVELDEGLRLLTNIVQCPVDAVHIGMRVQVEFEDVADDVAIPRFRPVV